MRTGRRVASSLSFRLLILVLVAITPALVLVVYTAAEQRRDATEQAQEHALRLGRSIAFEHQRGVNEIRSLLVSTSRIPQVREGGNVVCDRFAEGLIAENPAYTSFRVLDRTGEVLCASHPPDEGDDPSGQTWFERVVETHDLAVGDYEVDPDGSASIVFAYPIPDAGGAEIERVFAIGVGLEWINRRAAEVDLPPDSTLTVVDRNGTVLSRYPDPQQWVGQSVAEVPIIALALQEDIEGAASDVEGILEGSRLYGFVPFGALGEEQPLRIIVGIPEDEAFASVEGALRRNLIGLGAALAVSLVAARFLGELFVMRQVRPLVSTARRLAIADFSARTGLPADTGELGQVAQAIDQMAGALEEREAERVQAETQGLELIRAQAARAAAEAGQQRLQTLVHTSSVGVFVMEAGTRHIALANQEWRRIYGVDESEEARIQHLERAVHRRPDGTPYALTETPAFRALHQGETVRAEEMTIESAVGRLVPVLVSARPLLGPEGSVEGSVAVLQDTSPLQEIERMRSEFLGMVGHEMRTPLAIIKMAADAPLTAEGALDPAEALESLKTIDQQADRLERLIGNLRDVVQIEAGTFSVNPAWADLASLLREATRYVEQSGSPVVLNAPEGLPKIWMDQHRILQVVENLLNNAARYSAPNAPIRLAVSEADKEVSVRVTNRGPGIPREKQPYLFRKFSQLSERDRRGGSGLGLAISKGIVETHGGRIWVESAEDAEETSFAFTLPSGNPTFDRGHSFPS